MDSGQPRACLALLILESHPPSPGCKATCRGQLRACLTPGLGQGHFFQAHLRPLPTPPLILSTSTAALLPALLRAVGCLASPSQLRVSEGPKPGWGGPISRSFHCQQPPDGVQCPGLSLCGRPAFGAGPCHNPGSRPPPPHSVRRRGSGLQGAVAWLPSQMFVRQFCSKPFMIMNGKQGEKKLLILMRRSHQLKITKTETQKPPGSWRHRRAGLEGGNAQR